MQVSPVIVPPPQGSQGLIDLTVNLDPTSQAELKHLAATGQLTQAPGDNGEGSIDLGLRALFQTQPEEVWNQYPLQEGATEQLFNFYREAGKQALTLLNTDGMGGVSLITEAPGLQHLAEKANLVFDLNGDTELDDLELGVMLSVLSRFNERNTEDQLETSFFTGHTINSRINNSVMYDRVGEDGSLVWQGGLSMDILDYMEMAFDMIAATTPSYPLDAANLENYWNEVGSSLHPTITEEQWNDIMDIRFGFE
jgi:hypothetical protein